LEALGCAGKASAHVSTKGPGLNHHPLSAAPVRSSKIDNVQINPDYSLLFIFHKTEDRSELKFALSTLPGFARRVGGYYSYPASFSSSSAPTGDGLPKPGTTFTVPLIETVASAVIVFTCLMTTGGVCNQA
jgi:hypothetical protein